MKTVRESVDVLIAGGGTAGHVAALQAGRAGALTSVIESGAMLEGTMTAGGVNMPNHFSSRHGPVVRGIAWELFVKSKEVEGLSVPDYRERRPSGLDYYLRVNSLAARDSIKRIKTGC